VVALLAILKALRRAVGRNLGTLESIKVNNLFLFVALLVAGALASGQPPKSAEPFFVLLGFLLLFPLSSDPLGKIPPARLALWPLTGGQRLGLRLASRDSHWDLLRHIPQFPGRLGGLVRKDMREMLSLMDPYAALLLSIGGGAYRLFGAHPDPAAFAIVGLLVALTMSTCAQSLFGLELDSGMTRYRLLPLGGWEILLAKDIAFLAVLFVPLLPLDPAPGMTFGLAALALGHHSSVLLEVPQQRWRFTGGLVVFVLAAVGYFVSLRYYGRRWERRFG
jgi:hypothetical protein